MNKRVKQIIRRILGIQTTDGLEVLIMRGLKVGNNFKMMEGCIIDDSHCWHIEIGNDVTLAPRVHILAHDASTKMHLNYTRIKNVNIGNKVFIGAGSIIMPGVKIGDNVIIGAGSIVTKSVPGDSVYAGNPAKFICTADSFLKSAKCLMNSDNTFGEDFTLRGNVNSDGKRRMKDIATNQGVCFVT
jgi:maltose O-acetyltransferase